MKFALTGINNKNQQFISVDDSEWDDGMKVGTKTGFVEVLPQAGERKLEEFKSGKLIAVFGDKNRTTGLYEIQVIKAEAMAIAADGALVSHEA